MGFCSLILDFFRVELGYLHLEGLGSGLYGRSSVLWAEPGG